MQMRLRASAVGGVDFTQETKSRSRHEPVLDIDSRHGFGKAVLLRALLFSLASCWCVASASTLQPQTIAPVKVYTDKAAFLAAAPADLVTEDFEKGNVSSGGTQVCSNPYDTTTSDDCWSAGDIASGLTIYSYELGGVVILGAGASGSSIVTKAELPDDPLFANLVFPHQYGPYAAGMDLSRLSGTGNVHFFTLDSDGNILQTIEIAVGSTPTFLGVITIAPFTDIAVKDEIAAADGGGNVVVDNVSFGNFGVPLKQSDLSILMNGTNAPLGTLSYTVTMENHGPDDAPGAVATFSVPPSLATVVSNDCGGSNGATWTKSLETFPSGSQLTCHIIVSVTPSDDSETFIVTAQIQPHDLENDLSNNYASDQWNFTGTTANTPKTSLDLFRSFPDVVANDETGTPFSMRANADKVILVQMCAVWCPACHGWSKDGSSELKQAVDQSIGPGHFLDVDVLVENHLYQPTTQSDAETWKRTTNFPGPVLHDEGYGASPPLFSLFQELYDQNNLIPGYQQAIPYFFVLSPGCDNQIVARGMPGSNPPSGNLDLINEDIPFPLSDIDAMAALITQVWQQRTCAKPLVHRLNACSIGSAPVLSVPSNGKSIESSQVFTVPSGQHFDIESVTTVTDASVVDFTVYADAAGFPGNVVCSSPGTAATAVYGSGARKMQLASLCKLGPGNYWMGLKGQSDTDAAPFTWFGGQLSNQPTYLVRDSLNTLGTGCASWGPAGTCVDAAQQNTQLCFMLDKGSVLFTSGFEANGL